MRNHSHGLFDPWGSHSMCGGLRIPSDLHMGCFGKTVRTGPCCQHSYGEVWRAVKKYKGDFQSNISKFRQRWVRTVRNISLTSMSSTCLISVESARGGTRASTAKNESYLLLLRSAFSWQDICPAVIPYLLEVLGPEARVDVTLAIKGRSSTSPLLGPRILCPRPGRQTRQSGIDGHLGPSLASYPVPAHICFSLASYFSIQFCQLNWNTTMFNTYCCSSALL